MIICSIILEVSGDLNITEIMDEWVYQACYPVVTISRILLNDTREEIVEKNYFTANISIKQEIYFNYADPLPHRIRGYLLLSIKNIKILGTYM